jgi:pyruvate-formate lyase-activating enzyme
MGNRERGMQEDFVFRFRLEGSANRNPILHDPLAEMVRSQFFNLLEIALPCSGDKTVKLDGFRLLGSPTHTYPIFAGSEAPHPETSSGANPPPYEPRIEFIARQLESLLSVVELESGGKPVSIDGFRLRNLNQWVSPQGGNPTDVLMHAASRCNCDCIFCYNHGAGDTLKWPSRSPKEEWKEIRTRIRSFEPLSGRGLFPSFGSPREALVHPFAIEALSALRAKTSAPIRISTNGTTLREETVERLASLGPIFLDVSLNSSSPQRRAALMRDPQPDVAINSLRLLREHGIPYTVTIVAWPFPTLQHCLQDLKRTTVFADKHLAALVQVNLPGYSRFFSKVELFDSDRVWKEVVECVQGLREQVSCPVVVRPAAYEENLSRTRKNLSEVIGVVPNSPAARGGIQPGDYITRIHDIPVKNRPQARDLLTLVQESGKRKVRLEVRRGSSTLTFDLDTRGGAYPFTPETGSHLGVVFMGSGFREAYLENLRDLLRERDASEALLLSSQLIKPTLDQLYRENPHLHPGECRLAIGVPENRYFGGNIILGDLLVVQDFIDFIELYLSEGRPRPDLIIIPSSPFSLFGWGRDLTGRVYLEIERKIGIEVALLPCETIWD